MLNGDETDTNRGGSCGACADNLDCAPPGDCLSGVCDNGTCAAPDCGDGVETDLDCGSSCQDKCGSTCLVGAACTGRRLRERYLHCFGV